MQHLYVEIIDQLRTLKTDKDKDQLIIDNF